MSFNSIPFLFLFLPLFLAAYFLAGEKCRKEVLFAGSMLFYLAAVWPEFWAAVLLLLWLGCTYWTGELLQKGTASLLVWVVLGMMVGTLLFFKIFRHGTMLPVGMSFYLFQMAAYLLEVKKGNRTVCQDRRSFLAQITMFPKLLSGPLADMSERSSAFSEAGVSAQSVRDGLQELIVGLSMKVLLANPLGGLWAQTKAIGFESVSPLWAWLAITAFAMQLYYDFYGYSMMACGLGKILGFSLPENFDAPYAAGSVAAFFRRWHMTLGRWFRYYVYIPLGGNRMGKKRTALNLLLTWILTGLWHGIGVNYLIWGLFLGGVIVVERLWLGSRLEQMSYWRHCYTILVILISWVPFAVGEVSQIGIYWGKLLFIPGKTANFLDYIPALDKYAPFFVAGIFLALPEAKARWETLRNSRHADGCLLILFWLCVYKIVTVQQDSFAYFSF